ncbi:hypothetical protein [Micromonospora endolithica]|uniref:Uncharacterized protein n=1 Tax=Micromonospora endolithica TaxID=230091 RepID=A0A3A9ZTD2_9ACTN|nr:hypothetical protein [Micromonospora endolithica]RKN50737.1 hypothetical protein D7223_02955 [Micromonospora endolithica]TWJ20521.1 hypothetical protein JD76_00619 [Micromonospora endolithica]
MSTFSEYAALARHLADQRRAGERGAAAEAERRRDRHAAADSLQHRLTAQGRRLDQLGRAIGLPPSALPDGAAPPPPPGPPSAPVSGPPAWPPAAPVSGASGGFSPPGPPGVTYQPGMVGTSTGPGTGEGTTGGAAAAPGRPGVGAYSPGVGSGLALPTAAGVPGQRPAEPDVDTALELARRYADEADRHGQHADLLAQRPALLPAWSAMARAVAVYLGCALVGIALMLVLVVASGVGAVDQFTLYAWMCAGLPAVSLIAAWLILGRWGRPAVVAGTPPRFVHLGILICFAMVPLAYCGYVLVFRSLR